MILGKTVTAAKLRRGERLYAIVGIGVTAMIVGGLAFLIYSTWR
jgi:hypothetical protein